MLSFSSAEKKLGKRKGWNPDREAECGDVHLRREVLVCFRGFLIVLVKNWGGSV